MKKASRTKAKERKSRKFKLVCFDLDGTIIDETIFIWQTIHDHLNTDKAVRKRAVDDYYAKKMSYEQWMLHDIDMWKKQGAKKKDLLEAIRPLKLMKGAVETLKELKRRRYRLAIISGSLNFALEYVLPDFRKFFDDVFINNIFFDKEGNISGAEATPYDEEHKVDGLRAICKKEGIMPEECVFIGDHKNDISIAEAVGFSIAFNCKSDALAQVSDVVIEKKDLREMLKYMP